MTIVCYTSHPASTGSVYTVWTDPNTGVAYVGYWPSPQTSSCGATNTTGAAFLGAAASNTPIAFAPYPVAPCPTIEDAGIRAGEIIAYRAWKLMPGDRLSSLYMEYIWEPDQPNQANVPLHPTSMGGFYAFKDLDHVKGEFGCESLLSPIVYGEVALWGEVYEHERGYRAECAKITRIIEIVGDRRIYQFKFWKPDTLTRLRRKYGVSG